MGITILHSADWHLDAPFSSFPEEQRQFLRQQQRLLPGKLAELARQEGCDLVLLAGDLFDGNPGRESIEALKQGLADCGVPVFISPGNHDFVCDTSPWVTESWPENVRIFRGGLEAVSLPQLDLKIYGAGYQSMDCPPLLEHFTAEGEERWKIGLLHADPTGKRSPYCPITTAQVRGSGLNSLALGHIHKAGFFQAGDTLCAWPGCPMGRGWDETGERTAYLVTLGQPSRLREVQLDTLRFYDREAELTQLEDILPGSESADFYRVTLTGWGKPDVRELYRKFSHLPHLEFRDETMDPDSLWEGAGEDSLQGAYFALLKQAAETDPNARLAAEISRKLLAGKEVRLP